MSLIVGRPILPPEIRAMHVIRSQFITAQHFDAWIVGMPVRRHLVRRKRFSQEERDLFRRHHEYMCSFCPARTNLTIDHKVPQILGGSSLECNLRYCCSPCNVAAWQPYAAYLRAFDKWSKAA